MRFAAFSERKVDMANWIKAIYFVVILAWVIYVLSDDAVKYKSFPRRFGLSVALTVIIGLAGFGQVGTR